MQAARMQGLYNHPDDGIVNSHYHHHHNDRYQHQRHRRSSCKQCQILSPWLHGVTFSISGGDVEKFVSRISLATIKVPMTVPVGSFALFVKQCCAVFFISTVLMASCCDARKIDSRSFDRFPRNNNRVVREVHNSSFNSTSPTPSHSMYILASTPASSLSSSSTPSTNSNQPLSSAAVVERDTADSSFPRPPATKSELVALLISTLKQLNALQVTDSSCLRLEKIVQTNIDSSSSSLPSSSSSSSPPSSSDHNVFGVYLYFEEVHVPPVNISAPPNANMLNRTSNGSTTVSVLNDSCVSDPIIEVPRPVGQHVYQDEDADDNGTVVVADADSSTTESDVNGVLHTGRLSRTQIVVISTCSSIIGMFFIVAAILRIRNYIKRTRMEQEMAKRPKFRSCSVALRGATQSMEQLRRDSLASKTSHQNSDTTKGSSSSQTNGSSRENSSASSPRHDPDTAPLLLLAAAAQTSNPSSPTELQASLQYLDEEVASSKKKMISSASVTKSDIHLETSLKRCGQCNSEKVLVDSMNSFKRGPKTQFSGSNSSMPPTQNGQSGVKVEGNVNPSFSSGSIGYILLNGPDIPDSRPQKGMAYHLNMVNKTPGSKEEIPQGFAQTRNTDLESGKVSLQLSICSAKELKNDFNATKSNPDCLCQTKECQPEGTNDQQILYKNYSDKDKTTAVVRDMSVSLISQNNQGSLEEQTKVDISREHCSDQSFGTDIGDKLYPLLDISCFGFSQSDVSLSSVTNQGNEFFGQKEYHYPYHQSNGLQTYKNEAIINNDDKAMQIASNNMLSEANNLNINKLTEEAAESVHANSFSNTNNSDIQTVKKEIDNRLCAGLRQTNHVPANPLVDSSARYEQSACDPGTQELTLLKEGLSDISRPHMYTAHQPKPDSSTDTLDQNSNMLVVESLIMQSSASVGEGMHSGTDVACREILHSSTPADVPPSGVLHSSTPADVPPSGVLHSSTPADVPSSGVLHSSTLTDAAPNRILHSSISADVPPNGILHSSTPAYVPASGVLQSSNPADVVCRQIVHSSIPSDVPSSGVLHSSTPADVLSSGVLHSSTPADVLSSGVLHSSTLADVPSSGVLYSCTPGDVPASGALRLSTPADVQASGALHSSTPAYVPASGVLHSSTPAYVPASGVLHSSTLADVPSSGVLHSSTPAYVPASGALHSSTPTDVALNGILQPSTLADVVAPNRILQPSTPADVVASNGILHSNIPADVALNGILHSSTTSSGVLQSSTPSDAALNGILQPSTPADVVAPNRILQSSTPADVANGLSSAEWQSRTPADVAPNGVLQSNTLADVAPSGVLQSNTPADVAPNGVLQSNTPADVAPNGVLQSRTPADVAPNGVLQSNTPADVAPNGVLQSNTPADVAPNGVLQSRTPADVAPNGVLQSNTPADVAPNGVLQSNTPADVAPNGVLQSNTPADVAPNGVLQSNAPADVAPNGVLQSNTPADVAPNGVLQSNTPADVAPNGVLQSNAPADVAPNGVLQSNTPADIAHGLSIKMLTSIHTQTDEDIFQSLQEMDNENETNEHVFPAQNCPVYEANDVFTRSFSDSLDTFTASDSEQSSCQELQSSADLPSGHYVLTSQHHLSSHVAPNIDHVSDNACCRQSINCQGLETEPDQLIDDHQRNNNSLIDVNNRIQINGVLPADSQSSSVNSNDHCHQLLSLTTHNQVLNSSTY